ncbi:MAG: Gfo/Idh/MocA family oxidoreductase [Planctomycetota bacterium]|nr:Gfo/Idh/MocA family oxidoreductase [Planctomycetota bacterium]
MTTVDRRNFLTGASAAAACLPLAAATARGAARKDKIKIGQIGTGHAHAAGVFRQLQQVTDDYELVGIVENDEKRRQQLGDSYQGVKLISEEQLLNTPGLQAVVVETEVQDLLPTARRCVSAGMHIHLDKPAGENLHDFQQLLDEVGRRKLHLQMGYIYRYHPAFPFCYQAVADGWLGDVFEVHAVMSKKVGPDSRSYLSRFAGGSMFEIGCHVIDALVRVLGKPQRTTPYARQTHPDRDPLVDNQLAVFDYPRSIASIRSALVEYNGGQRRQFTVCGEFGTFDLRPLGGHSFRLALEKSRGKYKTGYQDVTLPQGPGIFISAFRDMAAVLRGEKANDYPLQHELAVHETVLRASGYSVD